ncbi:carbohydrate-binding protein [Undibacterium sp. Ji49W]|uniref:carbohydrate-binding protein n=1 Tax=Undibacterium sp. Ji49W TaxID=3413040 RepID=UPI003BEFCAE6
MVAIVSGNSTGLNLTSSSGLGQRGILGSATQGKTGEQNFVNIATGNLVLQDNDAFVASHGTDLGLVRTYNSQGSITDDNADAWWINGYRRIVNQVGVVNQAGSSVQKVGADNAVQTYTYDVSSNKYLPTAGSGKFDSLEYDASTSTWTWTDPATQNKEVFEGYGNTSRLIAAQDASGNVTSYSYNGNYLSAITSSNGDKIEFSYTGNNLTQERVSLADGSIASATYYRYDNQNRLIQVKLDLSPNDNSIEDGNIYVTNYSYLGNTNLIGSVSQTDGSQQSFTYVTLSGTSHIASITDALGRVTKFSYDIQNKTTTVTDPLGNSNVYTYDEQNRFVKVTGPAINGVQQQVQYRYDAAGNMTQLIDASGNSTQYLYDGQGNLLVQTDSLGGRIERTYGAHHEILTSTAYRTAATNGQPAANPETSRMVYDANFRPRFVISAEGGVTEYRYDTSGQRIASISYPDQKYPLNGLASDQSVSLSSVEQWVNAQNLEKAVRSDFQYNSRGQLSSTVVYNFVDANGNGVSDGKESVTTYSYDALGNLLFKVDADGNQTSFTYDALHRVLSSTDAAGRITVNHYDDVHKVITHTQANGRVDTAVYDAEGQLLSSILGGESKTEYRYDALGRLILTIDPTGTKQFYVYDAAGNLQGQVDGDGRVVEYVYNSLGQRIQTVAHSIALNTAQMADLLAGMNVGITPTALPDTSATPQPNWNANTLYSAGDQVLYAGKAYQARFSTQGNEPDDTSIAWFEIEPPEAQRTWSGTQYYEAGDQIVFDGQVFVARWSTMGDQPGVDHVWAQVKQAGKDIPWLAGAEYSANQIVSYDGQLWKANWSTVGDVPGLQPVWSPVLPEGSNPSWLAGTQYQENDVVDYAGQTWKARWTTFGDVPGDSQVWGQSPAPGSYSPWMSGVTYVGGETVKFNGHLWLAQWFTKGEAPGLESSYVWADQGVAPADLPPAAPPVIHDFLSLLTKSPNDLISRNFYDASGRLSKSVSAAGLLTEYQYDAVGNLLSTTQRANRVDASLLTQTSSLQDVVVSSNNLDRINLSFYDKDNRLLGNIDAEGYVTQYLYDGMGRRVEQVRFANRVGQTANAGNDLSGLLPQISNADQHSYTLYDAKGQVAASIDAESYLTEFTYDANGNLLKSTRYATKVTGSVHPDTLVSDIRPVSDAQDKVSVQAFDALNRVTTAINSEGTKKLFQYDVAGNLVKVTEAADSSDMRAGNQRFDQFGRLTASLSGYGSSLLAAAQSQQEIEAIWAQYGTSYTYDGVGRRTSVTDPNGNTTLFYYDRSGNLTHTINALGEVQERQFDGLNRLTATIKYGSRLANLSTLHGGLLDADLSSAISAIANPQADSKSTINYANDGTVASVTDELGAVTSFTYDAFGESVSSRSQIDATHTVEQTAQYDHRGLLVVSVADANGLNLQNSIEYDAFGRATKTVDASGNIREQSYDRLGRQLVTTDTLNAKRSTSYDAFGRVLTQTDATGNVTTYSYSSTNRSVTVTTAEGIQFSSVRNRLGQTASVTDANGNVTSYVYDKDGMQVSTVSSITQSSNVYDKASRLIQTTDANGNTVRYTYDAANRLLTRTVDANGLAITSSYQYDAKGQQVSATDANGIVTLTNYDLKGQVTSQVFDPAGINAITQYSYDQRGKLITVTTPNGVINRYVYDSLGRRIEEQRDVDGLKLTTTHSYDSNNNVQSTTDANGNITRYAYDTENRLVYTVGRTGAVQKNSYDAQGRVIQTTSYVTPIDLSNLDGSISIATIAARIHAVVGADAVQNQVYDKDGRLSFSVDGVGSVTKYTYDGNGNVVDSVSYANRLDLSQWVPGTVPNLVADTAHDQHTRNFYDVLNHLSYTISGTGNVSAYKYDGNGNVIDKISYANAISIPATLNEQTLTAAIAAVADSARDEHTRLTYDAANRLTWSVNGVGAVSHNIYDKNGNVVKQISYATPVSASARAETVVASAADRVSLAAYDHANRMVYRVDASGTVAKSIYDRNGNVVENIAYASQITPPVSNAAVLSVADIDGLVHSDTTNDRITRWTYDGAGRKTFTVDSIGAVNEIRYDANGNAIGMLSYANAINTQNLGDEVTSASVKALLQPDANKDQYIQHAFDASGRLIYSVDSLGYVKQSTYDGLGRVVGTTVFAHAISTAVNSDVSAISSALIPSTTDQHNTFQYDAAGELLLATDALGYQEKYSYDGVGNKISFTNKNGATWTYQHNAVGQVTQETSPVVILTTAGVDANGKLQASASVTTSVITQMRYDALGNLTSRTEAAGRPEERTTSYEYDALGRQVKTIFPVTTVYDASENVTANGLNGLASRTEVASAQYSQVFYDTLGNAVAGRDVAGNFSYKTYDAMGRLRFDVDAMGYVSSYERNSFGQATSITRYASAVNFSGNGSSAPDNTQVATALAAKNHSEDRTIVNQFDRLGRIVQVTEPQTWVSNGGQGVVAAKVTRNQFNALGQLTQTSVLADALTNTWASNFYYYDLDGRTTATVNALGYVTKQEFDASGNVTRVTEFANAAGNWTSDQVVLPQTSVNDRSTVYAYDNLNRAVSMTRLNVQFSDATNDIANHTRTRGDVTTSFEYDGLGNKTATTDALGRHTYTYYDAMNRVIAVASPTFSSTLDGVAVTPLTEFRRDAMGNVAVKIDYANGASFANDHTYGAANASPDDRINLAKYDNHGNVIQSADANGVNRYASFDAQNNVRKQWQAVTGNDGISHTLFSLYEYDALGRRTATITPATTARINGQSLNILTQTQAGVTRNENQYNAFGDVIAQGTDGVLHTYFEYDNAGNLWRTNSGDGIDKVMVYNLQGVRTEVISAGGAVNGVNVTGNPLRNVANAQQAEQLSAVRKTITQVDLLGRTTTIVMPDRNGIRPVIHQTFDRWNNVLTRSNLNGPNSYSIYQYNDSNQLIYQQDPDLSGGHSENSPTVETYYDRLGRQIAVRDALGNVNSQTWNEAGDLEREFHADGGIVSYYQNTFGEKTAVRDANGKLTTFKMDHLGQVLETSTDLVGKYSANASNVLSGNVQHLITSATYDQAGNVLSKTDGNGDTSRFTYDLRGNLLTAYKPMGQVQQAAYDVNGRQIAYVDANNSFSSWTYDNFGLLLSRRDIGGANYSYTYDAARQLIAERNTRGQSIDYSYDGAGQRIQSRDNALNKITVITYNIAGQHVREQTVQAGKIYQDNWLAYDAQGQLARVDSPNNGLTVLMDYDKNGNIIHQQEIQQAHGDFVTLQQLTIDGQLTTFTQDVSAAQAHVQSSWYAYDNMQRQTLVDGALNGNADDYRNINNEQGHVVNYDKNGNRISDTSWGNVLVAQVDNGVTNFVMHEGFITQYFHYDAANRLERVSTAAFDRNWNTLPESFAIVTDQRYYDGAGRLVESGLGDQTPVQYRQALLQHPELASSNITTIRRYDANGRLLVERVNAADGSMRYQTDYTDGYDAEGHALSYVTTDSKGNVTRVNIVESKLDGYKQQSISTTVTHPNGSIEVSRTIYTYDANGYLVRMDITDAKGVTTARSFVNDIDGHILQSRDQDKLLNRLTTDGHVLSTWDGIASTTPQTLVERIQATQDLINQQILANQANQSQVPGLEHAWFLPANVSLQNGSATQNPAPPATGGQNVPPVPTTTTNPASLSQIIGASNDAAIEQVVTENAAIAANVANGPNATNATTPNAPTPNDPSKTTATAEAAKGDGPRVSNFDESGNAIVAVKQGDTLQSLALAAYGDAKLWYLIADANGISGNANLMEIGSLKIPTRDGGTVFHSMNDDVQGIAESDFWTMIPGKPGGGGGGCGGIGKILMVVVAVVVTVYTAGALSGALASGFSSTMAAGATALSSGSLGIVGGAVAGAAGSFASQTVGIAIGEQNGYNLKGIALAAVGGGVSAGLAGTGGTGLAATVGRAAAGNVITQGVAVATGLQDKFDFKSVITSAVSAGVSSIVTDNVKDVFGDSVVGKLATGTVAGTAASVVSSVINGKPIDIAQSAVDAFGNAAGGLVQDHYQGSGTTITTDVQNTDNESSTNTSTSTGGNATSDNTNTSSVTVNDTDIDTYSGASVDDVLSNLPDISVASSESNVATTKDDLMRSEKASYKAGSFDGRDVTKSGDTLTALFKRNYGYTPSADELIQYANYNNLSSAHDLSINRVIESPGLDVLKQVGMTDQQKSNYLARDAQYQTLFATRAEEARQSRTMSQEEAGDLYMRMGGRNSEAIGPITYHTGGGNSAPAMESRPIYDAMGNYSGTEWVPVDNTPVRDPVGEAIVRVSKAAWNDPVEAGKGVTKSILNIGPGLVNLPIMATKLAAEGYLAIGNQFGLVSNDTYQTFRDSQPWQLHTWSASNDAQRFGLYGTDAAMVVAGGVSAWSNAGKISAVRDAEQLASYTATNTEQVLVYRGTNRVLENRVFDETGHVLSDAGQQAYMETGSLKGAYSSSKETHQNWVNIWGTEDQYVQAHGAFGTELKQSFGLDKTLISVTTDPAQAAYFSRGGTIFSGYVPKSLLLEQTLPGAGESEYLLKHGTNLLKPHNPPGR